MKTDISKQKQKYLSILGQNVKRLRKELNMSQEELGNRCGHTTSNARSWVSKIENGVNDPSTSDVSLLAKALGVKPVELMENSQEEERKACELFQKCYGQDAFRMVQYFLKLDASDRSVVEKMLTSLLSADKYAEKKEAINA